MNNLNDVRAPETSTQGGSDVSSGAQETPGARPTTWVVLEVEARPGPNERLDADGAERGLSGAIRRRAYRHPEYLARRWMLLGFADRVDALGERLSRAALAPLFWLLRANRNRAERRRWRARRVRHSSQNTVNDILAGRGATGSPF